MFKIFKTPIFFDTENLRKLHYVILKTMDSLNRAYGITNLILTIRERFLFVIYLHFWLVRNETLDLILASANFFKIGMIFYYFQLIKNEASNKNVFCHKYTR